jgi:DNA polymerase-3 subunit delta
MDFKTAMREIRGGQSRPVYVCYGTETDLIKEFVEFTVRQLIEPEQREFAVSRYDLAEVPVETVVEDAETPPFLAAKKLIVADQAFFLTGKDKSKAEHRLERLADYLDNPADFTVLVFTVDAEKLDERKKIVKQMKTKNMLVSFNPMTLDELRRWIRKEAEKARCSIEDSAVDQLLLLCGTGLSTLRSELEKLTLYAGDHSTITVQMVEKLVPRSTEQNVFMLIDEAIAMNAERVFDILHELIKQREEPIKIVALIARQFRIMLQAKTMHQQGYSQQQIASRIAVHPFAVRVALKQSARYSAETLSRLLKELADLDYAMKSGRIDKLLGLELFLLRLMSQKTRLVPS